MLYEIRPTEPLLTLLKTFYKVGGQVHYVLIGGNTPEEFVDPYTLHKAAAVFTIEALATRYPQSPEKGPDSRREPEKIRGTRITPAEFFAPGHIGIPLEKTATLPLEELALLETELDKNIFSHGELGQYLSNYQFAFSYPPYHLHGLDEHAEERLFPAINYELFGDNWEALTIYNWSTDWADYFNEGHEWWGSFLWTVYSTQTKVLVGIAVSAS